MSKFNDNKEKYHFWHSPLSLGILFCILVLFSYNMFILLEKERETTKKKQLIEDQIEVSKNRENKLSSDIAKLQTEEGIESAIREKYQVVKPKEKMVVILDNQDDINNSGNKSNSRGFWNWIKKVFKL